MQPRIETLKGKKLVGKRIKMSFSDNKTFELWRDFMPKRTEIKNNVGSGLYSIEVYAPLFFNNFNPKTEFDKWAAIEVTDFNTVPDKMETITLPSGLYAVFLHNGPASTGPKTYQYIFGTWLPNSDFLLDNRPHFAVMGEKYKNEDPSSEEELWIPIKPES
jgi:AraC family transcriptional regulator